VSRKAPDPPKVVIIGNGPSAMSQRFGEAIDKCAEVIRINRFKIKGFEDYVGRKTTTWAHAHTCKLTMPSRVCDMVVAPKSMAARFRSKPFVRRYVKGINWPSVGICVLNQLIEQDIRPLIVGFDAYNPDGKRRYWDEDGEWDSDRDPHDSKAEAEYLLRMSELGCFQTLNENHDMIRYLDDIDDQD